MISFEPDDEQLLIRDNVRSFAAERLWPAIRETEKSRGLADAILREAGELGLGTLALPEAAGGHGLPLATQCLVEEALAWGDPGACWALPGPGSLGAMMIELGDEAQRLEVLGRFGDTEAGDRRGAVAWSEARPTGGGFMTTGRADGDDWVLSGMKAFVVNGGIADRIVVFAQVDGEAGLDGIGAFVVSGDDRGLSAGPRRRPVGLDAAHIADLLLDDVRVPGSARLLGGDDFAGALTRAFLRCSLTLAARAVGAAQRAFELSRDYCAERKAFGKPIGHFQAVAFTVADRLMDVESARWMVWKAAADWDRRGEPRLADVAGAGAHALEVAQRCGDDGVQLHGGAGFIRDYAIEKLFRDARQMALMGPSVETLDIVAAELELGRDADPAALWPTSDIQPVCL